MEKPASTDFDKYKEDFIKYIYPEIKDLGKQFLTLVSAILTFAIFFARDFIASNGTSIELRLIFGSSLFFLIISILFVGEGIRRNYSIFIGIISNTKEFNEEKRKIIERIFLCGGFCFVLGLILLSTVSIWQLKIG